MDVARRTHEIPDGCDRNRSETPTSPVADRSKLWVASGAAQGKTDGQGDASVMSGTRSFTVTGGTSGTFALVCRTLDAPAGTTTQIWDPHITVLFIRT